jgi:tetratricopeptide (TPR) repeat protein
VGKTQIAIELAYRTQAQHSPCSVFWVPTTNVENIERAFRQIGQQLQISGLEDTQADIKKLVQQRLSEESAGEWMLIFDNADDTDMWLRNADKTRPCLKDYLPNSKLGCILFTTRSRKTAFELAGHSLVEVPEMDKPVAARLLQLSLPNREVAENDPAMLQVLRRLTCLPLAIMQAAAYMDKNDASFSEYLALLQETKEEDVIEVLSEDFEDDGRYREMKNPVATTWLISFQQIEQDDDRAAEYLSFMSCIDPKDIPQSLLPPARSRKEMIDAVGTLCAYSFVTKRTDEALNIHRLVHLATRNWLRAAGRLTEWTARATARLGEVFPNNNHENQRIWRLYLPHAQYLLASSLLPSDDEDRIALLEQVAFCLFMDGRYRETEKTIKPVIEYQERKFGETHPRTIESTILLANAYSEQGKWEEAKELQLEVLQIRKKELGEKHRDTLIIMHYLAATYWRQGAYSKAEQLQVEVLETRKEVLKEKDPAILESMHNLALTYKKQGRYEEAEQLQLQTLEIRKKELGTKHPSTLTSMNNLASTYNDRGRYGEAEQLQLQTLEIRKKELGEKHPDTLESINNLALMYNNQGRHKEAEQLQLQTLEICKKELGEKHPSTLTIMGNLASMYRNQGRYKEAEQLQLQTLEIYKKELGEKHPNTLIIMNNLAVSWMGRGLRDDAIVLMKECSELRQQVLGDQHPHTLNSLRWLEYWQEEESSETQRLEDLQTEEASTTQNTDVS